MATIFISYSRADSAFAHSLANDLRSAGHSVWQDVSGLRGGQGWAREIDRAVRACDAFVIILSPDSVDSRWVNKETLLALDLDKPTVPILWRHTELPVHLVDIQHVDFRGNREAAMSQLLDALPPTMLPPSLPPPGESTAIWFGKRLVLFLGIAALGIAIFIVFVLVRGPSTPAAVTPPVTAAPSATVTPQVHKTEIPTVPEQTIVTGQAEAIATALAAERATVTAQAQETATALAAQQARAATRTAEAQAALTAEAIATANAATTQAPPTAAPTAIVTSLPPPQSGQVLDCERDLNWRLGDEPYGQFERSTEQVHGGSSSCRLSYDFPAEAGGNNYVVFHPQPSIALSGQPTGLVASVYGNGSGDFLNAWIQDAAGERRQYTFGRISHQGWRQMVAWFDEQLGWPNVHIDGTDDGVLSYPVSLNALIVDGVRDGQASSGVLFIDEVTVTQDPIP